MRSYVFRVVLEPGEDVWRASVPDLEAHGASTWGYTCDEALRNVQEVMQMALEELIENGVPIPESMIVADELKIVVNVE